MMADDENVGATTVFVFIFLGRVTRARSTRYHLAGRQVSLLVHEDSQLAGVSILRERASLLLYLTEGKFIIFCFPCMETNDSTQIPGFFTNCPRIAKIWV